MRELIERGKILPLGARILGDPGALEERGKGLALVVGDRDDAPRRELAMVGRAQRERDDGAQFGGVGPRRDHVARSEEHTSELQSLMRISYAVFCLKQKK